MDSIKSISLIALASCITCFSANALFANGFEDDDEDDIGFVAPSAAQQPQQHVSYVPAPARPLQRPRSTTSLASTTSSMAPGRPQQPYADSLLSDTSFVPARPAQTYMASDASSMVSSVAPRGRTPMYTRVPINQQLAQAPDLQSMASRSSGDDGRSIYSAASQAPSARPGLVLTPEMLERLEQRNAARQQPAEPNRPVAPQIDELTRTVGDLIDQMDVLNNGIQRQQEIIAAIDPQYIAYLNSPEFKEARLTVTSHMPDEMRLAQQQFLENVRHTRDETVTPQNLEFHLSLYNDLANIMDAKIAADGENPTLHQDAQLAWMTIQSVMESTDIMLSRAINELGALHRQLEPLEANLTRLFQRVPAHVVPQDAQSLVSYAPAPQPQPQRNMPRRPVDVAGDADSQVSQFPVQQQPRRFLAPRPAGQPVRPQITNEDFLHPENLDAASVLGDSTRPRRRRAPAVAAEMDAATAALIEQMRLRGEI